jgi:hypothetical protein
MTYPAALTSSRNIHIARLRGKAALLLLKQLPDTLALTDLYSSTEDVLTAAPALDELGLLRPRLIATPNIASIQSSPSADPAAGAIENASFPSEGIVTVTGWAILPVKNRPADGVVLTYDDSTGEPLMFAIAITHNPRDDIAKRLNDPGLRPSGWTATFARAKVPQTVPSPRIRAWALDAETALATQLPGSITIKSQSD